MKTYRYVILTAIVMSISTLSIHAKAGRHAKSKNTIGNSYYQVDAGGSDYFVISRDRVSGGTSRLPNEGFVAGATITKVKGDGQRLVRKKHKDFDTITAIFEPLIVKVKDAAGKPLVNVRVLFQPDKATKILGQAVQIVPSGDNLLYVMTDKRGDATLGIMSNGTKEPDADDMKQSVHVYYEDGPFTIIASFGDQKVSFHLEAGGS